MDKVFWVIDQVPASAVDGAHSLKLSFIPRTTPVGHATLSTGREPAVHRIQGREWHEQQGSGLVRHNIEDLPLRAPTTALRTQTLAAALRRDNSSQKAIVIAAAKAFLPFLFGAWDSDIAIYPTTVKPTLMPKPEPVGGRPYALFVRVHPFTRNGRAAVAAAATSLEANFSSLCAYWAPNSYVFSRHHSSGAFELSWWVDAHDFRRWASLVDTHGPAIDEFYADATRNLLNRFPKQLQKIHIQSWFSTDFRGHLYGVGTVPYLRALSLAIRKAKTLASRNIVVITSDHGGRVTPQCLTFDSRRPPPRTATTPAGVVVALPIADEVVASGDHLVAYSVGSTATQSHWIDASGTIAPATVPPSVISASFAQNQAPSWLMLPHITERFARPSHPSGGGDHGAVVDAGVLSDIDAEVPLIQLGGSSTISRPNFQHEVRDWFVSLR